MLVPTKGAVKYSHKSFMYLDATADATERIGFIEAPEIYPKKKISESHGQVLYHVCLYDNTGKLIRNDPIFLSQPKRQKHM